MVRSKELEVDPAKVRGTISFSQSFKTIPCEDYEKVAGNFVGQAIHAYNVRKYKNLEDLALANHNDT